jgi:hypothetical protein
MTQPRAAISGEGLEVQARARRGQELFWGGAVCWWGERRERLTPDRAPFRSQIDCPVPGLRGSLEVPLPVRYRTSAERSLQKMPSSVKLRAHTLMAPRSANAAGGGPAE